MIVLSDETARQIQRVLNTSGLKDKIQHLVKALEPMDNPGSMCSMCVHEDTAGYEEPCDRCVFLTGTECAYEAKPCLCATLEAKQ